MTQRASASPSLSPGLAHAAPVLDIEAGVERLMGNRTIYLRALARFRNDYRSAAAIRHAIDAGNGPDARRLAHTLKGAAGMIEAPALYTAAQALEAALRDGAGGVDALLAQVDAALQALLRELDAMVLLAQETPPAPVPATAAAAGDSVALLRIMLDIGDGAAVELVAGAQDELCAYLGKREFEELSVAVANFDYERALDLLDRPRRTGS